MTGHSSDDLQVSAALFAGMHSLRRLDLWGTPIPELAPGCFNGLSMLEEIVLHECDLEPA